MVLILDGAKIKDNSFTENAIMIEKKEKCPLSSAFSMVGDALEKKSKIYKIEGLKTHTTTIPAISLLENGEQYTV